jgi:hypothetical protein
LEVGAPSTYFKRNHKTDDAAEPGNDPEITQNGIEFLQRLLPKYSQILMGHQPSSSLEYIFMFTLKALAGSDPLPKQAAADFWVRFLSFIKSIILILLGDLYWTSKPIAWTTSCN